MIRVALDPTTRIELNRRADLTVARPAPRRPWATRWSRCGGSLQPGRAWLAAVPARLAPWLMVAAADPRLATADSASVGPSRNSFRLVAGILGDQFAGKQLQGAFQIPFQKRYVPALRINLVPVVIGACRFERRFGHVQCRLLLAQGRQQVVLIEFANDLPLVDDVAHVDRQFLDDPACLALNLHLGNG